MSLFDLLLIVLVLGTAAALLAALVALVRRRWKFAGGLLTGIVASWIAYIGSGTAVAVLTPQRIVPVGEDRCFDEMCFAVTGFERTPSIAAAGAVTNARGVFFVVDVRVSNRSQGHAQREAGRMGTLLDQAGRVYQVSPEGTRALADNQLPVPGLDAEVDPGHSLTAKLVFDIPVTAPHPAFVLGSNLWFNPATIVIADEAHFLHKKTIVPLG